MFPKKKIDKQETRLQRIPFKAKDSEKQENFVRKNNCQT